MKVIFIVNAAVASAKPVMHQNIEVRRINNAVWRNVSVWIKTGVAGVISNLLFKELSRP
jgi:hypothetical protein